LDENETVALSPLTDGGGDRRVGRGVVARAVGRHVGARGGVEHAVVDALDGAPGHGHARAVARQLGQVAGPGGHGDHRLEAARSGARGHAELQLSAVVAEVPEGGVVAPVEPVEHLDRRDDGHAARLGLGHDVVGAGVVVVVGVHVGGEDAVVAVGAQGAVEERLDVAGDVDLRLVGELRRRLVDVDE
jgi:hypothetical protein